MESQSIYISDSQLLKLPENTSLRGSSPASTTALSTASVTGGCGGSTDACQAFRMLRRALVEAETVSSLTIVYIAAPSPNGFKVLANPL
jgi:hypothetical protein